MLHKVGSVLFIRIVGGILLYLVNVVIARHITVEDYGLVNLIMTISMLSTIISVSGTHRLLTKEIAVLNPNSPESKSLFWLANINVLIFFPLSGTLIIIYAYISEKIPLEIGFIALFISYFQSGKLINEAYLVGTSKSIEVSFLENILKPLLVILLFTIGTKFFTADSKFILLIFLTSFFFIYLIHITLIKPGIIQSIKFDQIKSWNSLAIPFLLVTISLLIQKHMSIFLLGTISSIREVAYFSVAMKVSTLVLLAIAATNQVYMPVISNLYRKGELKLLQTNIRNASFLVGVFGVFVSLLLFIFGEDLLQMFGDDYVAAKNTFYVLVISVMVSALCGPVGIIMSMTGHAKQSAKVMLWATFIGIIINFLLIPKYGSLGAAIGTLIAVSLWNLKLVIDTQKFTGIQTGVFGLIFCRQINEQK